MLNNEAVAQSLVMAFVAGFMRANPATYPAAEAAHNKWAAYLATEFKVNPNSVLSQPVSDRLVWSLTMDKAEKALVDNVFLRQLRGDFGQGEPAQIIRSLVGYGA